MKKLKNLPVTTAVIENLSHDGRGIARMDGKTTFISGALPGEKVEFQYTRLKKDFDEGRVLSVIEPSSLRVTPRCDHFEICGGCSLQHIEEQAQIHLKENLLKDILQRVGHVEPEIFLQPLSASSWNYRHKARLSVNYIFKKQSTLVGFRERNQPRYIADIRECPVMHPKVDAELSNIRTLMDTLDARESIAQIEVAAGDEEVSLIIRHLKELNEQDKVKLCAFAAEHGFTIFLQPAGPDSIHILYPEKHLSLLQYALPDENLKFHFRPQDFTQINPALNRQMVARAMDLMVIQNEDIILDLFCGLGNFSLPMARCAGKVIGVEGCKDMVERAKYNAEFNQLFNTEFYCENLDQPDVLSPYQTKGINKLLIDPPRTGALEIVKQIDTLNPVRIVYVSCNPATLARDSEILVKQHGYKFLAAGVMDMFPHTTHVESIAVFEPG